MIIMSSIAATLCSQRNTVCEALFNKTNALALVLILGVGSLMLSVMSSDGVSLPLSSTASKFLVLYHGELCYTYNA